MVIFILLGLLTEIEAVPSDSFGRKDLINQLPTHQANARQASLLQSTDKWFAWDKFHHFSYSLGITGLSYHIYHCQFGNPNPGARYFSISITAFTGVGKEVYDKYCKKTVFSYKDLTADAVGIIIGTLLFTR